MVVKPSLKRWSSNQIVLKMTLLMPSIGCLFSLCSDFVALQRCALQRAGEHSTSASHSGGGGAQTTRSGSLPSTLPCRLLPSRVLRRDGQRRHGRWTEGRDTTQSSSVTLPHAPFAVTTDVPRGHCRVGSIKCPGGNQPTECWIHLLSNAFTFHLSRLPRWTPLWSPPPPPPPWECLPRAAGAVE